MLDKCVTMDSLEMATDLAASPMDGSPCSLRFKAWRIGAQSQEAKPDVGGHPLVGASEKPGGPSRDYGPMFKALVVADDVSRLVQSGLARHGRRLALLEARFNETTPVIGCLR